MLSTIKLDHSGIALRDVVPEVEHVQWHGFICYLTLDSKFLS